MKYKLLAADMDSTALNSKKELTPRTVAAMEKAIEQGKIVVFSTGRSISLVKPYIDMVRGMRYAVTGSGASVIDTLTGEKLLYETMDPETVKYIAARAAGYVMPIIFIEDKTYSSSWCVDNCADFGLSAASAARKTAASSFISTPRSISATTARNGTPKSPSPRSSITDICSKQTPSSGA